MRLNASTAMSEPSAGTDVVSIQWNVEHVMAMWLPNKP
jgi:hypothetical protein